MIQRPHHGSHPQRAVDRAAETLTLAITSGKGGVGKTSVVANLALSLARRGLRVTVLDADMGLANVDVLLGLVPERTIEHFFTEDIPLEEIAQEGPLGVKIIPAGSGIPELTSLPQDALYRFVQELRVVREQCDVLLIDTAAGIGEQVSRMLLLADRVLLVTWPEPTALVDAYASLKVAMRRKLTDQVGLIVNGVKDRAEALRVHNRLETAAKKFLDREIEFDGYITKDEAMSDAAKRQRALVLTSPFSPAARCFEALADRVSSMVKGRMRGAVTPPLPPTTRPLEVMH